MLILKLCAFVCQELQMDQQAKKHLQEEFDAALEEKDQMIHWMQRSEEGCCGKVCQCDV